MDIGAWLRRLELERYERAFRDNDVDLELLYDLDGDDLKELGVASLGHRKRLLNAITALAQSSSADQRPHEVAAVTTTAETAAAAHSPTAERRQLTVMFVDLVGSTELSASLDPEDMHEVIRDYQNAVAGEIGRVEGHVAKFMGDGVLAYFGYPRAHEDEAERAVRVALALATMVSRLRAPNGSMLSARFGIATGLVVVGDLIGEGTAQEQSVVGDTPNLAARLQALARPDQVVIAEATRRLLSSGFAVEHLGFYPIKGVGEAVAAYAVMGERPVESRFDSMTGHVPPPMVARDQDLALLLERWAVAKTGEGQCVLLIGEAGIGKSRISRALLDELAGEEVFRVRYQCSPYHSDSAFWPVIQQLTRAAGLEVDEPADAQLDKLEALLDLGGGRDGAPLIATLVGLDGSARYSRSELAPQVRRTQTLATLVNQLLGLTERRPVMMIIEDTHWIDPTTLEMIEQSLERISAARVMILMTSRPDNQPAVASHPRVARLTLNRLGRRGVESIISRLGGDDLPAETVSAIVTRADGVPLFAEELTKAVLETGEASIPATLHDSLMARLDRVSEAKEVAQIAACIGREFEYALLAALADRSDGDLQLALDRLADAELIFRRGVAPDAYYIFKHALVRDAAYQSLLRSRRQELHARLADVLASGTVVTSAAPELLAHHHSGAGQSAQAIESWQRAGERAAQRAANHEAIQYFNRALGQLRDLPEDRSREMTEFKVLTHLGPALMVIEGWAASEVREVYERAHELAVRLEGSADLVPPLIGIWLYYNARGQYDRADKLTAELFHVAKTTAEDGLLLQAHHAAWPIPLFRGSFKASNEHIDDGLALYDADRHKDHALIYMGHDPAVCAHACGAQAAWALGLPDRAQRHAVQAIELARRIGHIPTLAFAHWYVCGACAARGDAAAVLAVVDEQLALSQEQKLVQTEASAQLLGGWAQAVTGETGDGLDRMRAGFDIWNPTGMRTWLQVFNCLHADALIHAQRYPEALESLGHALRYCEERGERWWESRIHHLRAEALLHSGDGDSATHSLQTAIDVAQAQGAKSWELRAATRLAEIWADRGRRDDARDLLAPLCDWFTEGHQSTGLLGARRLLDDLG